jgi:hypothetical protein
MVEASATSQRSEKNERLREDVIENEEPVPGIVLFEVSTCGF